MDEIKTSFKKRWIPEEDKALRQIKENLRYKSWNIIAKKMATDFGFCGRSEKQCRDRYENYLKSKDNEFEWTKVEEYKMFKMFVKEGSRWELISSYFSNIKGIHIKNKFYTRVRKAIRQVNAVIEFYYQKKYSLFEFSVISKLVSKISKNVEQLKYDKCLKDESQLFDKYSKTLFQLIELTNQEDYELFPELEIKNCSPLEKKKLFKKLIRTLKNIQLQNSKPEKSEDNNNESSNLMIKCGKKTDDRDSALLGNEEIDMMVRRGKIECNYKIISNQEKKDIPINLRIISRIKKIKPIQKPLKEDHRPKNDHSHFSDNKEQNQLSPVDLVKVEENERVFPLSMDFNNFYPLVSDLFSYMNPPLKLPTIPLYYNFN